IKSYANDDALRQALRRNEVDFIFGDAIALAFWINGTDSAECCAFSGGPFVESRYFGEGIGIAVRKGNDLLRQSLNWALFRLWEKGRYTDLWLRFFSISPFLGTGCAPSAVIARSGATKQSTLPCCEMDCFASLAMTVIYCQRA